MAELKAGGTNAAGRPLSPHLQVYRWTITMTLSILHRVTGAALGLGAAAFALWLVALALGPDCFARAQAIAATLPGRVILFGFIWALMFHSLNGLRHLAWDLGLGFAINTARMSGWLVLALSLVLALVLWAVGFTTAESRL